MSLTIRLLSPALFLLLACTPKDEADGGDEGSTAAEEGTNGVSSTTTGDSPTTADTAPSNPTQISSGDDTGDSGTATTPSTTTTPGTTTPTTADESSSVGTVGTSADSGETATDSDTDTGPDEPPVACEGEPEPIVATTIMAYTLAQVPADPNPTTDTGGSGSGGDPLPPDTMFIKFSNQQFSCQDPQGLLECGSNWELTITIAPEFQFPGLYNLGGSDGVFASSFETDEPMGNPDDCGGGGGGGFGGTLEIVNITDTTVEGRICGIDALFFNSNPDLDGSFVAERCK